MKRRQIPAVFPAGVGTVSSSGDRCRAADREWRPGQLVRSKAGRDKGRWYLVLALHDNEALLSDGRLRPREHPKIKNIRHLQPAHQVAADFDAICKRGGPADEQIRAMIAAMLPEKEQEG